MAWQLTVDHDQDGSAQGLEAFQADPCMLLEDEVENLQEQITVLEEGLPAAPGAQRVALAKEIDAYRRELASREAALRRCRGADERAPDRTI
jgi:hypothetical protein